MRANDNRPKLTAGSKAYLDTIDSGLVPCIVLSVAGNSQGHICSPSPEVKVRVTAERGAYHKGNVVLSTAFHVCPRVCRVKRGYHYRINTGYDVVADAAPESVCDHCGKTGIGVVHICKD